MTYVKLLANMIISWYIFLFSRVLGRFHEPSINGHGERELEVLESGLRLLSRYHTIHNVDRMLILALSLTH